MAVVRVVQVIGGMNLGGAESMIMNLYRRIDKTKVQFDFLVQAPSRCAYDDEIENLGGHIYHISRFKGYNSLVDVFSLGVILYQLSLCIGRGVFGFYFIRRPALGIGADIVVARKHCLEIKHIVNAIARARARI